MPTVNELMSAGIPALAASRIAQDSAVSGLTAAGATQATAVPLTSKASIFSTVAVGTGCLLGERGVYLVMNNGANALTVYPPVGSSINGGATNAGYSVPAGKHGRFDSNGLIWFANVSA